MSRGALHISPVRARRVNYSVAVRGSRPTSLAVKLRICSAAVDLHDALLSMTLFPVDRFDTSSPVPESFRRQRSRTRVHGSKACVSSEEGDFEQRLKGSNGE